MTIICEQYNVLVSLDVILETHIGTAALINPRSPMEIIKRGYFKRDSYDFWEMTDLFSKDDYLERWNTRNIDTLKVSVLRNIVKFAKIMLHTKILENVDRGDDLGVKVIINGFPYHINNRLKKYISEIMKKIFIANIEIEMVYLKDIEVTMDFLKNNDVYAMFLNDFNDWLKLQHKSIKDNKFPKLEIYCPMICKDLKSKVKDAINTGEIDEKIVEEISPYRASEISLAEYVSLTYLPIDFFSIPRV